MVFSPVRMHIPDGFLSLVVSLLCWLVAAGGIAVALRQTRRMGGAMPLPMMGVLGAAIFAGQMLNFPIAGGTSGHLLGAALAAVVLGLWPAVVVMTSVVTIQALVFQDGGILALGANLVNMALLGVSVAYGTQRLLTRLLERRMKSTAAVRLVAGFGAAWASIVAAALACAFELALSGSAPAPLVIPAMVGVHALIGLVEGALTVGALRFIAAARPEVLAMPKAEGLSQRAFWVSGLLVALGLVLLSPFASTHPDGLEWVAEELGFLSRAQVLVQGLMPDYVVPGLGHEGLATIVAGVIGLALVVGALLVVTFRRKPEAASQA